MRNSEYYAAVYGIIENEKWQILLMKRSNTGYMDGHYGLPSGHLEWYETLKQWIIREIKEEICIDVWEQDLEMVHSSHRINTWERVYFDFYFLIKTYSWEIWNGEPEKCSDIEFLDPNDERIIPYVRDIFKKVKNGEVFSEKFMN
jgi:mutator protein MutT